MTTVPSIRRRLASMLYEALLLAGVFFFGFLLPNIALGVALETMLPRGILLLYLIVLFGAYFIWQWRRTGQTLAMKTWKIRLESIDGGTPAYDQLWLRYLLSLPGTLLLVGLLWAVFDRDRQFLHDRLSGTRLVFIG